MSVVKKEMMLYAFDVIINRLSGFPLPLPEFDGTQKFGIFVTLHKMKGNKKDLRGCIGSLAPIPVDNIKKYALYSAFSDNRFRPLSLEEVPSLEVEISLLHSFEKAKDALDWEVGKHGILIDFEVDDESFSGTFLPSVAKEQGWSIKTTLKHLVAKAGHVYFDDLLDDIELTRYQTESSHMTFAEYVSESNVRNRDIQKVFDDRGIDC